MKSEICLYYYGCESYDSAKMHRGLINYVFLNPCLQQTEV